MSRTPAVTDNALEKSDRSTSESRYLPAVDIYESPTELVAVLDLPGVERDGIEVEYKEGTLTVEGRVPTSTPGEGTYLWREYRQRHFVRAFRVRTDIDAEKISATHEEGVLTIRLPKAAAAIPRKIAVEVR